MYIVHACIRGDLFKDILNRRRYLINKFGQPCTYKSSALVSEARRVSQGTIKTEIKKLNHSRASTMRN